MAQIRWTPQSRDDLNSIFRFISRDTQSYADLMVQRILGATERLGEFPQSGRIIPELGRPDVRELIVQNYRVIYTYAGGDVEILTVHHGTRLIQPDELAE